MYLAIFFMVCFLFNYVGGTMQNNPINSYSCYPQQNPNAVSINIYSPQAYGNGCTTNPVCSQPMPMNNYYPVYGPNAQPNLPLYPANYNNMINRPNENPEYAAQNGYPEYPNNAQNTGTMPNNQANKANTDTTAKPSVVENYSNNTNSNSTNSTKESEDNKKKKDKKIIPLNDQYIQTLENYLNDANPKIRLLAAKELLERLKEDENRKDNPSLIPLINKILQDTSPTVRFLGLTSLQLGYCTGDDKTVSLLKQIQAENKDKIGQEQLLASEILLKMTAPDAIKIKEDNK